MNVVVMIRDEQRPGSEVQAWELEIASRTTLRDLIRTRVREEVAAANADPAREHRTLVQPHDRERTLNSVRSRVPRWIDWEEQARVAEDAFQRNGFFVIVADRQVDDLDEELDLVDADAVRFVRLTPLVGG